MISLSCFPNHCYQLDSTSKTPTSDAALGGQGDSPPSPLLCGTCEQELNMTYLGPTMRWRVGIARSSSQSNVFTRLCGDFLVT